MTSEGQLAYATDPSHATPTWTNNGSLADEGLADNDVNNLSIYRDATGDPIIYADTKVGLFAHDYTNAKWVETELALPNHATCGKGAVWWRDGFYISAGLDVLKYVAGATATITSVGLDKDDGLPGEYRGEIVKLIKGYNEFFALVDSSLASGTGYSGVYAFDGLGWQCWWLAPTADDTMNSGIVSSAVDYRLFFDHDAKIYSISLEKSLRNPVKIPTFTFDASGTHITPWFDAAWLGDKLAIQLNVCCRGMSPTETVAVSYRINHLAASMGATDASTGWTALQTISADGETEISLGTSGVGIANKAIQFKFALARGSTNTLSPDILWAKLKYLKLLETLWGWTVIIDCTKEEYNGRTPSQLIAALKTAVSTQTLLEFTFRDFSAGTLTYYVRVANAQGLEQTGVDFRGTYRLSLVAL